MNSVQTVTPKQCTVTKQGWVHSTHTQNPGREQTARAMPRSCALLCAQQAGHVRMRAWSRALPRTAAPALFRPKAQVVTPNHHKAAKTMSRHQIGVATPLRPIQVATSKRGRDTVSPAQPQTRSQYPKPSRDLPGD